MKKKKNKNKSSYYVNGLVCPKCHAVIKEISYGDFSYYPWYCSKCDTCLISFEEKKNE